MTIIKKVFSFTNSIFKGLRNAHAHPMLLNMSYIGLSYRLPEQTEFNRMISDLKGIDKTRPEGPGFSGADSELLKGTGTRAYDWHPGGHCATEPGM